MKRRSLFLLAACAVALTAATPRRGLAIVSFTGTAYTQNFDALLNTGTTNAWTNDTTLPGWHLFKLPATPLPVTPAPIATYAAGTGSSNSGVIYSFGAAASTERALGGVASNNSLYWGDGSTGVATDAVAGWIAVAVKNDTAATINEINVSFDGEQWRTGGATPGPALAQTMVMEWGVGATFATVGTWAAPGGNFDWASPITTNGSASVDGNGLGNVPNRGGNLTALNWTVGSNLWVRWIERNDPGNDHGLAVDDFELRLPGAIEADFDNDLDVDGDDFLTWQRGLGAPNATHAQGNTNPGQDSDVDADDLAVWIAGYGQPVPTITPIPEPSGIALAIAGLAAFGMARRRNPR